MNFYDIFMTIFIKKAVEKCQNLIKNKMCIFVFGQSVPKKEKTCSPGTFTMSNDKIFSF